MSGPFAIGATMRVIASLLDAGIGRANIFSLVGGAQTTVHPPDLVPIGNPAEADHLNLFLYTITSNPGWRNVDRTRNANGERVGRPPLAIDLHFMLSAYGAKQYHPELLLGIGMQVLHEQPFLDRDQISALFTAAGATAEDTAMATARLDQQIEQIKISPHDLSADELYKLWSAFGSKCRPSAAYVATVVLIDSPAEVKSAPPVLSRNLGVLPYVRPSITQIVPAVFNLSGGPQQVRLSGSGFQAPGNIAVVGQAMIPIDDAGPDFALVTIPLTVAPGPNLLQIVQRYPIGEPPDKLVGQSSPVAFIVQPAISGLSLPIVGGVRRIAIAIVPDCQPGQVATVLLDQTDAAPGATPHRHAIDVLPEDIAGGSLSVDARPIASGRYLVRVRIAGTESVPSFDPSLGFTGPTVTL
jgi:hypothetical protein